MRKRMGNITYNNAEKVVDNPAHEAARQELLAVWRRENMERRANEHLTRIVREDGIAQNITEIFGRDGRPPKNVTIGRMVRMYNKVDMQWEWINSIIIELEKHLRRLDVARFLHDKEIKHRTRQDTLKQRELNFLETLEKKNERKLLPPKVRATVLQAITIDTDRSMAKRAIGEAFLSSLDISRTKQIGEMLNYLFFDHINEEDRTVTDDFTAHYDTLSKAVPEFEIMRSDLERVKFDLQEFIESADALIAQSE